MLADRVTAKVSRISLMHYAALEGLGSIEMDTPEQEEVRSASCPRHLSDIKLGSGRGSQVQWKHTRSWRLYFTHQRR